MTPELCVVIPTLNERPNIEPMIERLEVVLEGVDWEAIFVDDDSKDGTPELVREISAKNPRIRCLHRIGRRGLSSACLEGMGVTNAKVFAVIDADMQHDETKLKDMLDIIRGGETDLVVGSRYMEGGSTGEWSQGRVVISKVATVLAGALFHGTRLSDPMSGFFMITREGLMGAVRHMSGKGFKILVDIVASNPGQMQVAEVPYTFRPRVAGETKLDTMVIWEYLLLLYDKMFGRFVPVDVLIFISLGVFTALVHLALLGGLYGTGAMTFFGAQVAATVATIATHFTLGNIFTYRDKRLKGGKFLIGLLVFGLVAAIGGVANIAVADYLFLQTVPWWGAGLIGAGIGAVWNYAISLARR